MLVQFFQHIMTGCLRIVLRIVFVCNDLSLNPSQRLTQLLLYPQQKGAHFPTLKKNISHHNESLYDK
jgi:hypothetical protein